MTCEPFELFWSAYPRRIAKGKARVAFAKALKITTLDEMLTALEWQREQPNWQERDEGGVLRWVPHPASWLNGERWSDEQPVKKVTSSVLRFLPVATCTECIDGWREDDTHRVYRCACRTQGVRAS